jgi:hypothetical protein
LGKKWYSYFVVTDGPDEPSGAAAAPAAPPQRASDLVPGSDTETTFATPVSGPVDLTSVYDAAKIAAPAHGYTVLKVAEMLRSEHISSLPTDVKRKSVMVALDAAGVKVADVVEDAVQRDRALDTYERVLEKHLDELRRETTAQNARLEEEMARHVAELRARIDQNVRTLGAEEQEFQAWQVRKRQEEATIAEAVSHFVSENPITMTRMSKDKGEGDVR